MNIKLKNSIYIMLFVCTFVPVCIWIAFSVHDSKERTKKIISENIKAIGGSQMMNIENFYMDRKENMETIAKLATVKNAVRNYPVDGHSEELDIMLKENEQQKNFIASISVVDTAFHVIGSSQNYVADSISDLKDFDPAGLSGEFFLGTVYDRITDSGEKRIVPVLIGIYDKETLIGYLIQEIDCEYFNRLRLQTDFLEDGTLYLVDRAGQLITAGSALETESREDKISTPEQRQSYIEAWNAFDHENNSDGIIYFEYDGQDYMTYFSNMRDSGWSLRITENLSAQWASMRSMYFAIAMEGIAVVVLMIFIQLFMTKKLVTPFNRIVEALKKVQETGDYSIRTGVIRTDEVGTIAAGIDDLLAFADRTKQEEEQKHREFAERVRIEAERLQHKQFLSTAMLANMPSGYHRCSPDSENGFPFLQLGSHFEEILGWTAEEIQNDLGNCYRNLIWPEDLEVALKYTDMVSRIGHGNAYDTSVYRMKHKDGGYRWITDATMFVDLGDESFFQGVIADITPYVEGMEEAKQLAEASSHAKTDFLSQMSHDIRTPMNAIIGFTHLANKADSVEIIKEEYLPKIETASNHLLMIINDVLEMNSIEKGKIIFHRDLCSLTSLSQEFMTVLQLQTEKKGIKMTCDIQVENDMVYCDKSRFNRVFMNLVSNAIKFTPEGGSVTITLRQKEKAKDGHASYIFKIKDTGIGMTPEFAPRVFEPFERERTSTVSRVEGTGLGMAIVKSIVEAAGGTISVQSAPNEGTTFAIHMTLALAESEAEEAAVNAGERKHRKVSQEEMQGYFTGKRILLVEDNEFNLAIAETILETMGFVVECAEDGHIAVQMVENAPSVDYYDVVLMDIQMPTMNGYDATREIRAMKDARADVKIIAATANAFESDKQNAKEAGMNAHISKPLDVEVLYTTLLEAISKKE